VKKTGSKERKGFPTIADASTHAPEFFCASQRFQAATRVLSTTRLHPEELDVLAGCQREYLTSKVP
jgi:hypothetical protein